MVCQVYNCPKERRFFSHAAIILAARASLLAGRSIIAEWPIYDEFGCVTGLRDNYGAIRMLMREPLTISRGLGK